jgi:PE-PPE domain
MILRYLIIVLFACAPMGLMSPIAHADDDPLTALMMGGSGMPTPSEFWQDTIITDYIDPATGANYNPVLVPTPESFASTSVPTGLADLQAAMGQQPADQPYLVEGYSQSAVITIDDELQLIQSGQTPPDVTLLLLGSLNRPDGGLFERFPGLVIPGTGASTSTVPSRPTPFPPSTLRTNTTSSPTSRSIRPTCWLI